MNRGIFQALATKWNSRDTVLPPKLRLCLFFIPELRSSSSGSSWVGDSTPDSQPIMAGTLSWRNCGNTPETHGKILAKMASDVSHADLKLLCLRSYQSCRHCLWNTELLQRVAWGASLCWRSFSLHHLQSEGGWEPILKTDYYYPSYSQHSCNT